MFHKNKRDWGGGVHLDPLNQHTLLDLHIELVWSKLFCSLYLKIGRHHEQGKIYMYVNPSLSTSEVDIKNNLNLSKAIFVTARVTAPWVTLSVSHWIWNGLWLHHPILSLDKKFNLCKIFIYMENIDGSLYYFCWQ